MKNKIISVVLSITILLSAILQPVVVRANPVVLVFGICLISYYGSVEVESLIEILIGVTILMASIIGSVGNTYYEKNIKVTPIEDKYFIDATKYKVVKVEGEIIYLKDNNKYNKEGEIIE